MAKSTRKRVASFLADIANEDDTDLPRAEADEPPVITARGGGMPASSPQAVDEPASVRADKAQSAADRKDARPSAEAERACSRGDWARAGAASAIRLAETARVRNMAGLISVL